MPESAPLQKKKKPHLKNEKKSLLTFASESTPATFLFFLIFNFQFYFIIIFFFALRTLPCQSAPAPKSHQTVCVCGGGGRGHLCVFCVLCVCVLSVYNYIYIYFICILYIYKCECLCTLYTTATYKKSQNSPHTSTPHTQIDIQGPRAPATDSRQRACTYMHIFDVLISPPTIFAM
jgi:hypothetical protein